MRHKVLLLSTLIMTPGVLFADENNPKATTPDLISKAMQEAEVEYKAELEKRQNEDEKQQAQRRKEAASAPQANGDVRPEIERLAAQVQNLRNQVIVERTNDLATQTVRKVKARGSKTVFNYREDEIFAINTAPERITDIQLKAGESLTSPPMAGDTVRWNVAIMKSGIGAQETTHVIVKPLDEDMETNLIIATDQRLYHLKLKSTEFHQPYVAWNYPQDTKQQTLALEKRRQIEERTVAPEKLNFKYEVDDNDHDWAPVRVFDDGQKTFLQMPPQLKVAEAPVLFLTEEDGSQRLVNYRIKGEFYIVDRLFRAAELRVGPKQKVEITTDDGKNLIERLFGL